MKGLVLGRAHRHGQKQDQGGGAGGGKYPAYKEGTAYKAGERVSNAGQDFECKPWPHQLVRPVGAVLRAGHGPELVGSLDRREVRR